MCVTLMEVYANKELCGTVYGNLEFKLWEILVVDRNREIKLKDIKTINITRYDSFRLF